MDVLVLSRDSKILFSSIPIDDLSKILYLISQELIKIFSTLILQRCHSNDLENKAFTFFRSNLLLPAIVQDYRNTVQKKSLFAGP